MELWFLRHARTIANNFRSMEKSLNDRLSPVGIKQALVTGKRLARERFDEIYISDMVRSKETLANMGHTHPEILEQNIIITSMIRERDWGLELDLAAESLDEKIKNSGLPVRKFKPDMGESFEDVYKRAENFLNYLAYKHLFESEKFQETNIIKAAIREYFKHEREMETQQKIFQKNIDDYSIEEKNAINEYLEYETNKEKKIWIVAPEFKGGMIVRKSQVRKEKESLSRSQNQPNRTKKILVLTHSGFINEVFNVCKKTEDIQTEMNTIFNCSISIVTVCCSETSKKCNGSCMNKPQGMQDCVQFKIGRRNDVNHTDNLRPY